MSETWVCADHHFGHQNIIKYCSRPWETSEQMDAALVKLHNSVVQPEDTVYFLGDITLKSTEKVGWMRRILSKMNGRKILIFGNHDKWHWEHYLEAGFQSCHTFLELSATLPEKAIGGFVPFKQVRLCHDPAWAQDKNYLWVCGHTHNNFFPTDSHIVVVCLELTDYKPIRLIDILNGWRPGGIHERKPAA